jgi:hypothetical protein
MILRLGGWRTPANTLCEEIIRPRGLVARRWQRMWRVQKNMRRNERAQGTGLCAASFCYQSGGSRGGGNAALRSRQESTASDLMAVAFCKTYIHVHPL